MCSAALSPFERREPPGAYAAPLAPRSPCDSIDRHDAFRDTGQRRRPRREAALEALGVQRGEDVAQMIMGRSALRIGLEPAQQRQLRLAETRDVSDRLGAGKHRQKAQKQHLR